MFSRKLLFFLCIFSLIGWLVGFIGLCTAVKLVRGHSWWIIIYNLLINLLLFYIVWKQIYRKYTNILLSLYVIGVIYNTQELIYYMEMETHHQLFYAANVGYLLLVIGQFTSLIILGNHQLLPKEKIEFNFNNEKENDYHHQPEIMLPSPTYPTPSSPLPYSNTTNNETDMVEQQQQFQQQNRSVDEALNTVFISPYAEYKHPVVCLHDYFANADDPNELSFNKGEILYVHDKRGSWWQAKKSDGTIGMIPNNFVTATTSSGY
ncbi:unnamed protein product [Cunninghamella blakesleeana]